jgi:cell division control protein 7
VFDATLTTLSDKAMSLLRIIQWATSEMEEPDWEQTLALEFLYLCLELNPQKRISAAEALEHPFLSCAEEDELIEDEVFLA